MNKKITRSYYYLATYVIVLIFGLWHIDSLKLNFSSIVNIAMPLLIGAGIAFVLNEPFNKVNFYLHKAAGKKEPSKKLRNLSLLLAYIVFFLLVFGMVAFIVPQLGHSVNLLTANFDSYYNNFRSLIDKASNMFSLDIWQQLDLEGKLYALVEKIPSMVEFLVPQIVGLTQSIIGTVMNLFLGLIFSVYILIDKENLKRQSSAFTKAILPKTYATKTLDIFGEIGGTFSNFINGQVLEACILAALCFIGMSIFGFQYALLISVIIGITNVVPIVGPIIGAVPCTLILLIVSPGKALWFVVFIIALQQLEANLIYPKVVGTSVGLPALWVLTSVLVGGGLFGVWGMIFGVPAMSVLYRLLGRFVRTKNAALA